MSKIETFEDITAWQLGRKLCREIYRVTLLTDFSKDFGLKDQMRRASVSIISNIAEGFERKSRKEFIQFLSIAKGSAGEIRAQLYIAKDLNYIDQPDYDLIANLATEISKTISGFMTYLLALEPTNPKTSKTL